jgi:hypothetical protein
MNSGVRRQESEGASRTATRPALRTLRDCGDGGAICHSWVGEWESGVAAALCHRSPKHAGAPAGGHRRLDISDFK